MTTRVLSSANLLLSLFLCLGLAACNQEDFFEKEFLENPFQNPTTNGGTHGGVDGGDDGGSDGTTTGGSTTGGTDGSTVGGTDGGESTGGNDGTTTGGTDGGATVGGTDGGDPGVDYEQKSEIFHQTENETKKLDILWVIDDSGSMSDEQSRLGYNFAAFIDEFILKDVDFKMAITTTDVSSSTKKGRMVPGSDTKLTSAKAKENERQFMADFRSLVNVGTRGSGAEKGLEATEGFMQKHGSSFVRSDAYLAVVILSDEEDQSPKAVKYYTDYMKSFKSEGGLVKVYSIVDVKNANRGGGITTGHERYAEASTRTGGVVADIAADFYTSLDDMGDSLINLLDSFALAEQPVEGSITVTVNGEVSTDFTFDKNSRSIKFNPNNLPPVGAEIKVTYLIEP